MKKLFIWIFLLIIAGVRPANAGNGINLIGFGAESIGMGGADLAVARDTMALNINPAGLSQLSKQQFDVYLALANALVIRHEDAFDNNKTIDNDWAYLADTGYAYPMGDFTLAIGAFAQGGIGIVYKDLNTAFGTTDELSAMFRIVRVIPGISWQLDNRLSLGFSLLVTYADLEQKVFPETSFANNAQPDQSFFGQHLKGADTISTGFKIGVLYSFNPALRLGFAYTSKTELTLDGGSLSLNMTAVGLGVVTYNQVEIGGINQPEEAGIGIAWDVNDAWLVSAEINWINWSDAINTSFLNISKPDNPLAPPALSQTAAINWHDQYVFALGTAYETTHNSIYRAGINIANNPIPSESITPLLAPIARYHVTGGYGTTLSSQWRFDAALEYQFKESETYTNPQLPLGSDTRTTVEVIALHAVFSRQW